MKIAWASWDLVWEDKEANFSYTRKYAISAANQGSELLVLPEMFSTGFSFEVDRIAESCNERTHSFLKHLAIDAKIAILGGYALKRGEKVYNVVFLFDKDGQVTGPYAKIHPFSAGGETERFSGGDNLFVVPFKEFIICPFICYDIRFPELFIAAIESKAEFFIIPANWPKTRRDHWKTLLTARAIETQSFVLGVNRIGAGGGLEYSGDSMLISPDGSIILSSGNIEGVFSIDISREMLDTWRERFPAINDKRPEVYRTWGIWT
ncbi:MAG: carbon-nitrogen family hydrolase [Candidatus Coatesbacteria bacterium]|nr:carbon-nitrogen family hydrolase [Candidatus Coatesbacteria bacterium]